MDKRGIDDLTSTLIMAKKLNIARMTDSYRGTTAQS